MERCVFDVGSRVVLYLSSKGDAFPGLLSLVYAFLDTLDVTETQRMKIDKYLDLVRRRSNGRISIHASFF
jgi:glutamate--cysteine ligase catalytic subunit